MPHHPAHYFAHALICQQPLIQCLPPPADAGQPLLRAGRPHARHVPHAQVDSAAAWSACGQPLCNHACTTFEPCFFRAEQKAL